ncbi:MAG TPA: hypothetical protein VMC07_02510 [Candidatus Omnitrophota bacterium]|nr:hypothetical protein [Candidatus Omnitrophota bacterium]
MAQKSDSFIHVKLEHEEVLNSKRDILASEMDILNIMKSMNRYVSLRERELDLKSQFYKEIKKIIINLKLLETSFPPVRIPKVLELPVSKQSVQKKILPKTDEGLEEQLRDIQRRLKSI